jgi:signal peptidase I
VEFVTKHALERRHRIAVRRRTVVAGVILGLVAVWWLTLAPTSIGGPMTYAVVRGTSMEPVLHSNDFLLVQKQSHYSVGQDVLYKKYGGMVVHRIRNASASGYLTQGVNNPNPDSWRVGASEILGSVVLKLPGFGRYVTGLFTHPLLLGGMAAGFAAFSFMPIRRRSVTPQLKALLANATEPKRKPHSGLIYLFDLMIVLVLISITGVVALSFNNVIFWPRVAMALGGMVVAVAATVWFGLAVVNGLGMREPRKSLFVLGPRLLEVEPSVEIFGPTIRAKSAEQLRDFAEVSRLPVLHWQDPDDGIHSFVVVAEGGNSLWEVRGE